MSDEGTLKRSRVSPVFDVDMGELVDGYQFDGRARAIEQWRERKEDQAFKALCNRLRAAKWYRDKLQSGGDELRELRSRHKERYQATLADPAKKSALRARTAEYRKKKAPERHEAKVKAHKTRAEMLCCEACPKTWLRPFRKGPVARFCSPACQQRERRRKLKVASDSAKTEDTRNDPELDELVKAAMEKEEL